MISNWLIRLAHIIYACLMLFPISSIASTDVNNSSINHITAAIYNSPPWGWKESNGQIKGIAPELIRVLVDEVDPSIDIKYILGSTERNIQLVLSNQADIVITFYDERLAEQTVNLGNTISVDYQAWSLAETPIKALKDLESMRLATSQYYKGLFEHNVKSVNYVSSIKNLIPVLVSGNVDVVAALEPGLEFNARKHGFSKERFSILSIRSFKAYIWISKSSKINAELQRWKDASTTIIAQDSDQQLLQRFLTQDASPSKSAIHGGSP